MRGPRPRAKCKRLIVFGSGDVDPSCMEASYYVVPEEKERMATHPGGHPFEVKQLPYIRIQISAWLQTSTAEVAEPRSFLASISASRATSWATEAPLGCDLSLPACSNPSGTLNMSGTQHPFSMSVGGGLEVNFSKTFAIRVAELDYFLTRYTNPITSTNQNGLRYVGGVVFRFD